MPIERSFAKAEEFYSGTLGLECSKRYDNDLGGEFETGSLTIQLVDMAKIGREFAPSTGAIALHVEDVEAARSELESRGQRVLLADVDDHVVVIGRLEPGLLHDDRVGADRNL